MPVLVGVNVTAQLETVELTLTRVHGDPVNAPGAVPVFVNATVPAGEDGVPATEVSRANAVQLVAWEMTIAAGVHETDVVVVRKVTVTVLLVPVLPRWEVSVTV